MPRVPSARAKKDRLSEHLKREEVLTSSELIGRLKATGLTDDNARQLLRRSANSRIVWRSERLRLPKDERLFATQDFFGSRSFYQAVAEKLRSTSRWGMARCLEVLAQRGALHKIAVMRLLAVSPDTGSGNGRAKRLYESELAALEEIGGRVIHRNTPLECVIASVGTDHADHDNVATLATASVRKESFLARILAERLRRQNVFSWNQVELPDPENPYTVFNRQVFSIYAFSYLSPLVRWKENAGPTPCPVLIDAYEGLCVLPQVQSFLQRIERATHRKASILPSLGIIAAKDFERDAWKLARQKGLMTVSFRQMFGDEALDAMILVEEVLHDLSHGKKAESVDERFEDFSALLEDLKANPIVPTLRSIGFEALTGLIFRSIGYESVELGRIVPWKETTRDVDAFGFQGDELRVVECKAHHKRKSLEQRDVTKFFTETVPALKKWLAGQGRRVSRCRAEIWTTGPLGRIARDELHGLPRPKGDVWEMLRGEDVQNLIPQSIRKCSLQLISAIRLERAEDGSEDNGQPSTPLPLEEEDYHF